mgnify:CR=1 FL=1
MIVIAVVGILAMVSIPNMTRWLSRMRLRGATQHVVSQIDITRKMSVTNRMRYCMTFTGGTGFGDGESRSYQEPGATAIRLRTTESIPKTTTTPQRWG